MRKIKVFIQTDKFKGGPAIFRSRIISALIGFPDIQVINNVKEKFDIELAMIRRVYKHDKPYVLRVDGCYYMKKQLSNKPIIDAIKHARYLIFQSKFAKKLCGHVLGFNFDRFRHSIIYNGIDLDYVKNIEPDKNIIPGSFVACAKWRPNKRPYSILKGFMKANTGRHLYMIGGSGLGGKDLSEKYNSEYIHILGEKSNKNTISIMKACDYLIHLCHIDSCPNIVIEGLCCGLNVLCSNLGGTPELVKNNGVVLKIDKFWTKKQMSYVNLDAVDKKIVAKGIHKLLEHKQRSLENNFDIKIMVEKYVKIIRENV